MRTIVAVENLTLDGVMQAPGGREEDTRGGFEHGGWAGPYNDDVIGREMGKGWERSELLFGRRTYEQFASFWPSAPQPNPFTELLNRTRKYVASRTLREPLPWENSTLLDGDARDAVAQLKDEPGDDLVILGSGELVRSLMSRGLIDQYTLLIHPLILGSGRRLFAEVGPLARLELVDSVKSTKGTMINTYRPA
jgi:dihydrofolate reductase